MAPSAIRAQKKERLKRSSDSLFHHPDSTQILDYLSGPHLNGNAHFDVLATECFLEKGKKLDGFGVDPVGRPILIFAGLKQEEEFLLSLIDAVAWAQKHRELLIERFPESDISPDLPPVAVLIAPEFSQSLLSRLRVLDGLDLELWETEWVDVAEEKSLSLARVDLRATENAKHALISPWALSRESAELLHLAEEKCGKISERVVLRWGARVLEVYSGEKLLGVFSPRRKGLRLHLPEADPIEIRNRQDLVLGLDAVYRGFVSLNLPCSTSGTEKAHKEPESSKQRDQTLKTVLTQAEMEAFT